MLEKLLVGVMVGLLIASILFQVAGSPVAYGLLILATCLCCLAYWRTLYAINKLSFSVKEKFVSSGKIITSAASKINQQEETMKLVIQEIEKIGDGRSDELSNKIDSNAGHALVRLKEKLNNYKREEATHNWIMEGVALMGELRKSIISIEDYARQVIAQLIKYLDANQGAFYLLRGEGEEQVLELAASYACKKHKYIDGKVMIPTGTGLLGQCIIDKEIVFLTQVPKDYLKITSGLGAATPSCILILPLVFGDVVYGAIEVASLQNLESYQLEFSKKVCANIAVELSAMLVHENTERLLKQTIQAQQQMKEKEQQISIKLEEVEAERSKNIAILNGCMDGVISFDETGVIGFANVAAGEIFNRIQEHLVGSDIQAFTGVHIVRNNQGANTILSHSGNEVTVRTEVNIKDTDLSLLITSAKVKVNGRDLFTLFIQKISVDLF